MTYSKNSRHYFQIAIDGPVAAGKGTVSKLLAERLGFLYVDTGATYRVATLMADREEVDLEKLDQEDQSEVNKLVKRLEETEIEVRRPLEGERDGRLITVLVDGEDVSWAIREEKVSRRVPMIAKLAAVREVLVAKQQEIARKSDVVMEGRDITYRVLPEANLKIYLDASDEERARRRFEQLLEMGKDVSLEEVERQLKKRDRMDRERKSDPLQIVPEAWHLDTTGMRIEEVVEAIVLRVDKLLGRK